MKVSTHHIASATTVKVYLREKKYFRTSREVRLAPTISTSFAWKGQSHYQPIKFNYNLVESYIQAEIALFPLDPVTHHIASATTRESTHHIASATPPPTPTRESLFSGHFPVHDT